MKKGQFPEELGWTLFVLVLVVIFCVALLVYAVILRSPIGKGILSPSVEFVWLLNKPYMLADSLSHYRIDDRQLIEHALESSVVGSLENSSSGDINDNIEYFMKWYGIKHYSVIIKNADGDDLLSSDNKVRNCGANNEGVCVTGFVDPTIIPYSSAQYLRCNKARYEISDDNKICGYKQTCCKDYTKKDIGWVGPGGEILAPCGVGTNKNGVCDYPKTTYILIRDPITQYRPIEVDECREGRVHINEDGDECSKDKLICCAPLSYAGEQYTDAQADVPLLYKGGKIGWLEVIVGV